MSPTAYIAAPQDLNAIEDGLFFVGDSKLDFIFKDRSRIEDTLVVTYDSESIYYWIYKGSDNAGMNQIKHSVEFDDREYRGWRAGLKIKEFYDLLPEKWQSFNSKIISGGPLTPFIEAERSSKIYNTYESFLATIVHEFGHIYYNSFNENNWYLDDKEYNRSLLETAKGIAEGKKIEQFPEIRYPKYRDITEIFAFCTDYSAASIFWPKHKADIDKEDAEKISELLKIEKDLDYSRQDTTLNDSHIFAFVVGTILIKKYGINGWVDKLIN